MDRARNVTVSVRAARLFSIALIASFLLAIATGWAIGGGWKLIDMNVYWDAGRLWRETGNPYTLTPGATDHTVYRYAPWFAAIWVPLSVLPRALVDAGWSLLLIAASGAAVVPLLRRFRWPAAPFAMLMGGLLIGMAASGNVQPLLIAWLVWGVERRSGPLWIALAASLKVVPILYVLVYAGRREWNRVGWAIGLTVALVAPTLLFERPELMTDFGTSNSLSNVNLVLWVVAGVGAVAASAILAARQSRYAWLASGVAVVLTLPRLFLYDTTFILPGIAESGENHRERALPE